MNKSSGNVLFLILIAVALFAALSYAVTQSTRSGTGNTSKEKMQLAFDEMQGVVIGHRTALQRMILAGVNPNHISIGDAAGSFANGDCLTEACRIYSPKGGGQSVYKYFQLHRNLTTGTDEISSSGVRLASMAYKGTQLSDFVYMFLVTEDFCNFINQKLGINTPTSAMVATAQDVFIPGAGSIVSLGSTPDEYALTTSEAPHLSGRTEGCYKRNSDYRYISLLYPN